jgi:flagellar basal body rod protein FlgG
MLRDVDGMRWMASAMRAAQSQLESATHNLANVTSDGYRRIRSSVTLTERGLSVQQAPEAAQGGIRITGRSFDLALIGPGAFRVGNVQTRDGAFMLDRAGYLADRSGRRLEGVAGPIRVSADATIDPDGTIRDGGRTVGHLRLPPGTTLRTGALESSSVDAIGETVSILTAQRAFETAEKTLLAIDQTREKSVNDVARLK